MITVAVMWGLWNQMFQYAFGRSLSLINNTELLLDTKDYETYTLHAYGLGNYPLAAKSHNVGWPSKWVSIVQRFLPLAFRKYIEIISNHFFPALLNPRSGDRYYLGYWQSPHYFEEYADIIRKEFTPIHDPGEKNTTVLHDMESENAVSIHIRRGDYVTDPNTMKRFGVCDIEYYHKAIEFIRGRVSDPKFYVFTNDVPWVKENFDLHPMVIVDWNGVEKNYEDIRLMSHCKHHIIANSSFSWWGAWLNPSKEKIVIAPEIWLANGSNDARDLIPKEWVRI